MQSMQSRFRVKVLQPDIPLAAHSKLSHTFQNFFIIKEKLASNVEIDFDDLFAHVHDPEKDHLKAKFDMDTQAVDTSTDSDDDEGYAGKDQNEVKGVDIESGRDLPPQGPPKDYEYTPFVPKDEPRQLVGHIHASPTMQQALAALNDLQLLIRLRRITGVGHKDPELDLWMQARLEGMQSMLHMYTNSLSITYDKWGASSLQAAIGMGRGHHCSCRLRELCHVFIGDRNILPVNPYGDGNKSFLADENLRNEISIYLLSIGNQISAKKLVDFLTSQISKINLGSKKK